MSRVSRTTRPPLWKRAIVEGDALLRRVASALNGIGREGSATRAATTTAVDPELSNAARVKIGEVLVDFETNAGLRGDHPRPSFLERRLDPLGQAASRIVRRNLGQ